MNTKDKGKVGELLVMAEAAKRGYTVCVPFGENQRYDLVLDRAGKLERVQVKCLTPKKDRLHLNLYTVMHNKDQADERKYRMAQYQATEVDLICVVNMETYEICMIPFSEVQGLSQVILRTKVEDIRQCDKARYCSDYVTW